MLIRLALPADRPHLEAFARAAMAERGYEASIGPVDWATIELTETAVAFLACDPEPIGCFIAGLVEHPLSGQVYAEQMLWYVMPARRYGRAGRQLLDAVEQFCCQRDIKRLRLVQPSARPRSARSFRKRGYTAIEVAWVKTL